MPLLRDPLDGNPRVTQWYGERPEYYAQFGLRGHNGIDYSCVEGTQVRAVADGVVAYVGTDPAGYGNYIRVWHSALRVHSFYGHLKQQLLKQGDAVKQGAPVGLSGNTGNSTGPHLHYELRLADAAGHYLAVAGMANGAVDPLSFAAGLDRGAEPFVPLIYEVEPEFLRCLSFVLAHEGGWSDNPADAGGPTMKGITLATYTRWCAEQKRSAPTKEELRAISDADVQQIYVGDYWLAAGCEKLPWPLNLAHFDSAVLTGVGQAALFLKASGGEFTQYMGERVTWFTKTAQWDTFGRGWIARAGALLMEAN